MRALMFLLLLGAAEPPTPAQEAKALLDAWLGAQNGGDFAAYQALYAPAFTGVRRSGPRTVSLDRAGWLKDRARMFGKPMKVEASNVRVFTGPKTARVVFTQRWSSGNYADVGPKHLLLRHEAGSYRILREELFTSVPGRPVAAQAAAVARLAFVLDGMVVLSTEPDDAWAEGPIVRAARAAADPLVVTSRTVDMARVPAALARLAGTRMRVYNAQGYVCEAKLGTFSLLSRALIGSDWETEEAWANGSRTLVAKLLPEEGGRCVGGTWARSVEQPLPPLAPAIRVTPALAERARAAFRSLPAAAAIQRRYARYQAAHKLEDRGPAEWTQLREQPPKVRMLRLGPDRPALISVSQRVWLGECSNSFQEQLWGLWEVRGEPGREQLKLVNEPDPALWLEPLGAVDSDGDGAPELLFDGFTDQSERNAAGQPATLERGVVRPLGGRYVDIDGVELRVLVCPC